MSNSIYILSLVVLVLLSLFMGCKGRNENRKPYTISEAKETLANVNKALVDRDREVIEAYMERHQLEGMQENGAGLFYLVWGEPEGREVRTGDVVVLDYQVSLLDGTICYTSDGASKKEFLVGQGGVESGLEMGVLYMNEGQRARLIIPPHLGHGLLGDLDLIPPRTIIVYDIHLLNIIGN